MIAAKAGYTRLELVQGDITLETVDAIVNAANASLQGGGGVDGAIHKAAGPELLSECRKLGGCPTGEARITAGYQLPARYVIHTVGPIFWLEQNAALLLERAHWNSLSLAQQHSLRSVAFPAISTGSYGYPLSQAAPIALQTIIDYIDKNQPDFELVRFVMFSSSALTAFQAALQDLCEKDSRIRKV
jgi:O-acetyl-ADP-ribose deacetylase (regulator of RNase III)